MQPQSWGSIPGCECSLHPASPGEGVAVEEALVSQPRSGMGSGYTGGRI